MSSDSIMKNSVIVLLSNYYSDNQINKNDRSKQVRIMQRRERLLTTTKIVGNPEWKTLLGRIILKYTC